MVDKGPRTGPEPSDLFKVEKTPQPSIAPVEKIVLPKEEALRQRLRRLAVAAVIGLLILLLVNLALDWVHRSRVRSALDDVIDQGTPSAIEDALELLLSDPDPEVRARLLATGALGGDTEKRAEAEAYLKENADDSDPNVRIAQIYLMLSRGDARGAFAETEEPAKYGDQAAAFLHGRALTSIARGQWAQAQSDALTAYEMRSGAPQLAAVLARITARTEGPDEALAILEGVDSDNPEVRLARARIMAFQKGDATAAQLLVDELRRDPDATVLQKAWAELISGMLAYRRGAIGAAYRDAQAAAKPDLRMDEELTLGVAQVLLALGQAGEAEAVLKRLSNGPSVDLFQRVHTLAWWYRESGDTRSGLATLEGADLGPDKEASEPFRALVLAELLADSGRAADRKRAPSLYEVAAKDPVWGVVAANALARAALEAGDPAEAARIAKEALEAHPNHLTLVDTATEALIASNQEADAQAITSAALEALEDEGWAHGSEARVLIAANRTQEALAHLDQAVKLHPTDAALLALRGDAARLIGDQDKASSSYQLALQLDPGQPLALAGLLSLAIDREEFERAGELVQQMDTAKVRDLGADSERLRYLMRIGAGQSGFGQTRQAVDRHKRNPDLRLQAARIYLQAGQYSRAATYFQQAKRYGAHPRTADTGAALAQVYDRRYRAAEKSMERADEAPALEDKLVKAWALVVQGRLALKDNKRGLAVRRANEALAVLPESADAALLMADIEEDRERSPTEALQQAANANIPMPVAAGRLAQLLGPTPEGCDMAKRYLKATRSGKLAARVRDVSKQCD